MTPSDSGPVPPPVAEPADGGPATAADSPRPPVSAGAAFVAGCGALLGLIGLGCVGVSILTTAVGLRETERGQLHERERIERRDAQMAEAAALLDEVAEWLHAEHAATRRFPRALREQPPADPWGNALLYTSSGLDRAELRSAGPDGAMDTLDDLVRTLKPR